MDALLNCRHVGTKLIFNLDIKLKNSLLKSDMVIHGCVLKRCLSENNNFRPLRQIISSALMNIVILMDDILQLSAG